MKVRIIAIILVVLAGLGVFFAVMKVNNDKQGEFDSYIELARKNAEKNIPYNAINYYRRAFDIKCDDEDIFVEYINQCEILGGDFYYDAINEYGTRFPDSPKQYEALCKFYYDGQDYKNVFKVALEAKDKEIATDAVREMFVDSRYKYKYLKGGLSEATTFLGKYARVKRDEFYGFIEDSGAYLIFPKYEEAGFFAGDSTAVKDQGEWMMINELGYKVAVCSKEPQSLSYISNGLVPVEVDDKYGYMDTALVVPDNLSYDYASNFRNNIAAVKKGEKWALINTSFEQITDYKFDDIYIDDFNTCISNGVVIAKENGKYGLYDATGASLSEARYDEIYPFVSEEYAAARVGDLWGFIDKTGQMVMEPKYEGAKSFCIGLAPIKTGDYWGYINTDGKVCIDCTFEDCIPFSENGVTAVKEKDNWSYIKLLLYTD